MHLPQRAHLAPSSFGGPSATASIYETLDRFILGLQSCQQLAQAIQPSVQAVQQSLGADVCFWYSAAGKRVGAIVGRATPSPTTCLAFASKLLASYPGAPDEVLWSRPRDAGPPAPHSALLVRVGSSQSWIVVLSFDPERQLQTSDLQVVGLIRRILINYHAHMCARLKDLLAGLVNCLTATIEAKDSYTAGHSERVARIGEVLARQMGLSSAEVSDVYLAGLLHDVGKIGVQDAVLQKDGALSAAEFAHVQEHAVIGDRIVASIRQFDRLRPGVRHHHEHFDGTGYPDRLAGEQIPRLARILAVADACDAMMSPRRYRPARTPPSIDRIFLEGAGKQFDPEVVAHFMACRHEIYPPIYQKGIGDSAYLAFDRIVEDLSDMPLVIDTAPLSAETVVAEGSVWPVEAPSAAEAARAPRIAG
jgi:HD-GYP domain-containing protein (c-di-GMP phosphodiesterase class II)